MRNRLPAALLSLVVATTATATAVAADSSTGETTVAAPVDRHWYGGPILLADGTAVATLMAAARTKNDGVAIALAGIGLTSYALAPGVLHAVHGHWGRGLGSAGLRLALPLVGGFFASQIVHNGTCHYDDDSCKISGFVTGVGLGVAAAITLDQLLAFDRHEPAPKPRALVVAPTLALGRGGGSLGLAGAF